MGQTANHRFNLIHLAPKAKREKEYTSRFANPLVAAEKGYVDDIIEPATTRRKIIEDLRQLETKQLENPKKKHGNIPL